MADKTDIARRFGVFLMASMFLVTSIAFTAIIFWQSRNESNSNQIDNSLEELVQNQPTGENMLEGTQLAGFTPTTERVNELQIIDTLEGSGDEVKPGATVTAHYTGALVNSGVIFQSSHDGGQPVPFSLDSVIAGWTEGVPGMKVGGTRRLVIPAAKAYGESGAPPSIPADSDLVFDIELVAVEQ